MTNAARNTINWQHESRCGDAIYDLEIAYRVTPGEQMIWRRADDSGYPGSPDEVEILGVTVLAVCDEQSDARPATAKESADIESEIMGEPSERLLEAILDESRAYAN